MALRRRLYAKGWLASERLAAPVIVVGNILVGGTGKTPLVIWLAQQLMAAGYRPGIISRGYGGHADSYPLRVDAATDPAHCGDEPLLIAQRTGCPVAVGPDRVADGLRLLEEAGVDILIADDGLQHYRLRRDLEIAVSDGGRGLGNGWMLPVGPLREPPKRLDEVDWRVVNGGLTGAGEFLMTLEQGDAMRLTDGMRRPLKDFAGVRLHAAAGIGNPERFFSQLEQAGLTIQRHPFEDHRAFQGGELAFADADAVLMTEKDGVKYRPYADDRHWIVPVEARLEARLVTEILERLPSVAGAALE